MKLFISYSRIDASETAKTIHNYLTEYGHHEVFIDTSNIPYGGNWKDVIQKEISNCDIFVIIVTPSALYRSEVEREVELAKKLKKKIIPCIAKDYVAEDEIKWELNRYQGFFYDRDSKLAMDLHMMIKRQSKSQRNTSNEVQTEIKTNDHSPVLEKQNSGDIESTQLLLERAKGLEEIGQYSKALKTYDEAIKISSNNFEAYFNKGLLHEKTGEFENARIALDKATDIDWKHKDVWYHLGKVLEKLEKYNEALEAFTTDLRIDNKDEKSWTSKAKLLEQMERYEDALECYDNILKIDPQNADALNKRKIIQEQLDKRKGEQKDTIQKTTINQKYNSFSNIRQLYDTCLSLYSKRMYNEAVLSLDEYLEIEPNYVEFWNIRGLSLIYLKKYDEAIESFNKALEIKSDFIDAKNNKLVAYKIKQMTNVLTEKSEKNGDYTAIIIGINNYPPDPRIPQLSGAENDAIEILDLFMKNIEFRISPYQFLVGPDATRKNILKVIKESAKDINYKLIIFYFSGYGIITEETSYIAPYDMDPTDIDTSCIKLEDLRNINYESKDKKSIFFILDCANLYI